MERIGCSNITVALTLIGVLPLIGGIFGFYEVLFNPEIKVKLGTLFSLFILLSFGLIACGYRNCLYINNEYIKFTKRVLFYKFKNKTYPVEQFQDIHIKISEPLLSDQFDDASPFYSIDFRGEKDNIDIGDHMRFQRDVLNKKSWKKIQEFSEKLSRITKLKISYSDKVKSYKSLK